MLLRLNPNQNPIPVDIADGGGGSTKFTVVAVTADYAAAYNDLVDGDPTAGPFAVTLPAASGATTTSNAVLVKNESDSPNAIAVTPAGGDTIDGAAAGSLNLQGGQCVYLVSDGISNWIIVSSRDVVVANYFPGADIGAKINAACSSLPNGGFVRVLDGSYVQTTKVIISDGVTVMLGVGTISNSFPESGTPPWRMKDNSNLLGSGFGTKLMNPVCTSITCICVTDFISASDNSLVGNKNLIVKDIQFIGNPSSTNPAESAAVQFGNINNVVVDHCWFDGVEGFGVFQASSSIHGNYGDGFVIKNCTFDNVTTQQCGVINCINWQIRDNIFRPTATITNYTIIDCESNTGTDRLRNWQIIGNTFDFQTSAIFNPGAMIQVVGGSGTPYDAGRAAYGVISNNTCIAGITGGGVYFANGINIVDCDFVEVSDNQIHFANVPIETSNCNSCTIKDNTTGTGGNNEAWHILIGSSFDCYIDGNKCVDTSGVAESIPNIAEVAGSGSDYNTFSNNWANIYPDVAPPFGTTRYAKITLIGEHSRAFNNVLGISPTPVDSPLITTIDELRALYPPGARPASAPAVVTLGGYTSQGDGGFGVWTYDPTSAAVDNGVTVVVPTYRPGGVGAWLRAPNQIHLDTTARDALVLTAGDAGFAIWNTTNSRLETWTGAAWVFYNASAA
jgi:hypothetical protein